MTVDVSRYRGQTIRFQLGTYNNGGGGISRTFLDDVALRICPPTGALVLPAGWAKRVIGRPESSTLYAEAGRSALWFGRARARPGASPARSRTAHAILSAAANTLYVGEDGTCYSGMEPPPVWRTSDGGASWQELPTGTRSAAACRASRRSESYLPGRMRRTIAHDKWRRHRHAADRAALSTAGHLPHRASQRRMAGSLGGRSERGRRRRGAGESG